MEKRQLIRPVLAKHPMKKEEVPQAPIMKETEEVIEEALQPVQEKQPQSNTNQQPLQESSIIVLQESNGQLMATIRLSSVYEYLNTLVSNSHWIPPDQLSNPALAVCSALRGYLKSLKEEEAEALKVE